MDIFQRGLLWKPLLQYFLMSENLLWVLYRKLSQCPTTSYELRFVRITYIYCNWVYDSMLGAGVHLPYTRSAKLPNQTGETSCLNHSIDSPYRNWSVQRVMANIFRMIQRFLGVGKEKYFVGECIHIFQSLLNNKIPLLMKDLCKFDVASNRWWLGRKSVCDTIHRPIILLTAVDLAAIW